MPASYVASNLLTSDAVLTLSSEDSVYPQANLYDQIAAKVFRCESTTSLTILIDFGAAVDADTLAIINHNLTSVATVSIKADNVNPPTTEIATPAYRQYDIWTGFTLAAAARFWLITITDNNTDNIQLGQLLIGNRVAFPRGRRIADGYTPIRARSTIGDETYAGVKYSYYLFERNEFNPLFRVASDAELEILRTLDALVYGSMYPFLYIPDPTDVVCYYVRKEAQFEPKEIGRINSGAIAYDYQMKLVEESRGLNIQE